MLFLLSYTLDKYLKRKIILDQQDLQALVETLSLNLFNKRFKHNASMNSRLRTTGGRYLLGSHHLEFNPRVFQRYGIEELKGVIIHELCHYHLHLEGKGYKHGDRDFKELLKQTGGKRYVQNLETEKEQLAKHVYQCERCELKYPRQRKINTKKYVCGKCKGKLALKMKS